MERSQQRAARTRRASTGAAAEETELPAVAPTTTKAAARKGAAAEEASRYKRSPLSCRLPKANVTRKGPTTTKRTIRPFDQLTDIIPTVPNQVPAAWL